MKKRLVGGDFLIDLSSLPLDDEYENEEIANSDVLEQLAGLKGFIGKDKSIKPLWVKAFVDTDDYTAEVVSRGELNKNNLIFKLVVLLATFKLIIDVEFEQLEDDNGNAIDDYAINSATYTFTSDASVGNLDVTGDLSVEQSSKVKIFENIVDKDGHARFIEGDINLLQSETIFEKVYGKWSLSGTHLMLVLAGKINAQESAFATHEIVNLELPQWILDKIYPVGSSIYIESKDIRVYSADYTTSQSERFDVRKRTGYLDIVAGGINPSVDRYFRLQFDLLIDNE